MNQPLTRRTFIQGSGAAIASASILPAGMPAMAMVSDTSRVNSKELTDAVLSDIHDIQIEGMEIKGVKFVRCTFQGEAKLLKECTFVKCGTVCTADIERCTFYHDSGVKLAVGRASTLSDLG